MATLVAATLLSTNVMANNTGHIGNQPGKDNDIEIVVGDIDNVLGNICNQSGSDNDCEIEIGNVTGDVVISDGATVIIGGEGGGADGKDGKDADMSVVNSNTDRIQAIEDRGEYSVIGMIDEEMAFDTVTDEAGNTVRTYVDEGGIVYKSSTNAHTGETTEFEVDMVTEDELDYLLNGGQTSMDDRGILGEIDSNTATNNRQESYIDSLISDTMDQEEITDVSLDGDKLVIKTSADSQFEGEHESSEFEVDLSKYDDSEAIDTVSDEVKRESQINDNQQIEIDRNKDAVVDLNNRVDETYDAMREGDEQLQTQVNDVNDRVTDVQQTLYEEGVIRAESDRIVAANAQKKLDAAITAQGEVDTAQDVKITDNSKDITDNANNIINNTVTINKNKAAQDAYNEEMSKLYAAHDAKINSNTTRITGLESRMDNVETEVAGIHNDNRRQDGMIAGVLAASTMEMPMDWNGQWAVQVGLGGYNSQEALALGLVTAGEGYAFRATITGTNADEFSELAYGASLTISTSIFE